jgi:hypothetical protein
VVDWVAGRSVRSWPDLNLTLITFSRLHGVPAVRSCANPWTRSSWREPRPFFQLNMLYFHRLNACGRKLRVRAWALYFIIPLIKGSMVDTKIVIFCKSLYRGIDVVVRLSC